MATNKPIASKNTGAQNGEAARIAASEKISEATAFSRGFGWRGMPDENESWTPPDVLAWSDESLKNDLTPMRYTFYKVDSSTGHKLKRASTLNSPSDLSALRDELNIYAKTLAAWVDSNAKLLSRIEALEKSAESSFDMFAPMAPVNDPYADWVNANSRVFEQWRGKYIAVDISDGRVVVNADTQSEFSKKLKALPKDVLETLLLTHADQHI